MSAIPVTGRTATLIFPFLFFFLLPFWSYFWITGERWHPLVVLIWVGICVFHTSTFLIQIGKVCPPVRRYCYWMMGRKTPSTSDS
jgi:hypothetical protein